MALPFNNNKVPFENIGDVRVLVSAPYGCPEDAMSIIACYITYIKRALTPHEYSIHVDDSEDFLDEWKEALSEDTLDLIMEIWERDEMDFELEDIKKA